MKHHFFQLFLAIIVFSTNSFGQIPPEIQDPWTIGINKLPPRTAIWPAPDIASAKRETYENAE